NEIINDDNGVKKILDNNKYQLSYKNLRSIEEVGNGGFSKVYKAKFVKNGINLE
ncbi:19257_t:CDS:1, partial [Gigaspora rosea]